jgi:amino acid adenylation domain-containing protein
MTILEVARRMPITSMQRALLSPALIGPGNGFEVEQLVWSINERVDVAVLQAAWISLHERHDALRLAFHIGHEEAISQSVAAQAAPTISCRELVGNAKEQSLARERFLEMDRRVPFDLSSAPLSRLTLLVAAQDCHHLVWTFPHALLDGRSISIILEDLVEAYSILCAERVIEKGASPAFAEYLHFRNEPRPVSGDYWQAVLGGFTRANALPQDPDAQTSAADYRPLEVDFEYSPAECSLVKVGAARLGVSVADLLQAAWSFVVATRSGQQDVVFGSMRACRHAGPAHLRQACGVLMNCLPKRIQVDPSMTVQDLATELHRQQSSARDHELDPLEAVARCSGIRPGERLFESIVMVDKEPVYAAAMRRLMSFRHSFRLLEKPSVPIAINATLEPHLSGRMIADPRRMSRTAGQRLMAQLKNALLAMAERPTAALATLPLMPADERSILVESYNASEMPIDCDRCLHQLFEEQVDDAPDRIAVVDSPRRWTYAQIECQANRLAHRLISSGVKPGAVVAVHLERSAEMVIALLAVLKAGAAYVPCDLDHPIERIRYVLEATAAAALITNERSGNPALRHANTIVFDCGSAATGGRDGGRPRIATSSESMAYILFTSGSTGTPKGVMINHRGAVNTILDCNARFNVTAADRIFAISSYTFDLSVYDIFGMLAAGAAMVLCPPRASRDPETWGRLVHQEGITLWNSVPALVEMLIAFQRGRSSRLATLRLVMMSGDWIPVSLPPALTSLLPQAEQFSLGGATEASIWSIIHRIRASDGKRRSIPYGRPMANQRFYVLDSQLRPCPTLVAGDLYIGGIGLAMGYWNDPVRTAGSFIQHPGLGMRLYRTGDQGRFLPEGIIEFLGRTDGQVKLNGFRIELGEIEAAIRRQTWVRDCIVTVRDEQAGTRFLAAYVIPRDPGQHSGLEVADHCRSCLPGYMVPAVVTLLSEFPLSSNGKVDRKALPIPLLDHAHDAPAILSREETAVADLWERLLHCRPAHPDSTFFQCGGDSLAAARLVLDMERTMGLKLPLSAVFEAPSVRQFAALLKPGKTPGSATRRMLPLQTRGNRPPFFLISEYLDIGRFIDRNQPLYGLFIGAPILAQEPGSDFADIANLCLDEMRKLQPVGPYYIGGHCFGAVVAFQLAAELRARGELVNYLGMMDPPAPAAIRPPNHSALDRYLYYLYSLLERNPLDIPKYLARGLRNRLTLRDDPAIVFSSFVPRMIDIDVEMFFAKDSFYRYRPGRDPRLAWGKWCSSLVIHETAGDHITFCRCPAVKELASLLNDRLLRAQESPRHAPAAAGDGWTIPAKSTIDARLFPRFSNAPQ